MTDKEVELSCAKNRIPVKNGKWVGNNLHIIDENGDRHIIINCKIVKYVSPEDCSDGIGYFDFESSGRLRIVK